MYSVCLLRHRSRNLPKSQHFIEHAKSKEDSSPIKEAFLKNIDAVSIDEAYTVTIYNTVGAVMMSHKYDRQTSGNVVLDVSLLENGVYFVSVKTEEGSSMKKVMINR